MKMKSAVLAAAAAFACNAHAANELKIGYLSTLSGPAGAIGVEIRDGFNLALKMAAASSAGCRPRWCSPTTRSTRPASSSPSA